MTLRRLQWLTVLAPLAFVSGLVLAQRYLAREFLNSWPGYLLVAGVTLIAALAFSETVFGVIERLQLRERQRNRELLALHEAGLDIAEELDLEVVLQRVVDRAAQLMGARYGALSLPTDNEPGRIASFITAGMSSTERARIGAPPVGKGLLGVVLREGERLRLDDLMRDPRAYGFPPGHPPMHSLLAVPIISRGRVLGNLYLSEKEGGHGFTADDEETLVRFATQAALAIGNARLHHLARETAISEERVRIAREMHDSLAQVLGYVNTKAQATQELLRNGQIERASAQIEQLGSAAREAYADVREHILNLRATPEPNAPERSFVAVVRAYLERWQEQSGVHVALTISPDDDAVTGLPPGVELQLLRLLQEALSNVRKHANAAHARVSLMATPGAFDLLVEDDGIGFDPAGLGQAEFPRFGLTGMRERAHAIGAVLDLVSTPGQGTSVRVHLPLRAPLHATHLGRPLPVRRQQV